ncbi:MAG: sulfotransferase, partial [Planctomycetota bacterium]
WGVGVVRLHPNAATPTRWLKACLAAPTAAPVAVTQQIIFSGYLLTTLRDRHSRVVAVLIPAILFGLAAGLGQPGGLAAAAGWRLLASLCLLQALLGMLRLTTGSIVTPAALLAGCILVRKVGSKSRLLGFDLDNADAWWIAPAGDPRQGLLLGGLIVVGLITACFALVRRGEKEIDSDASIDASFKRYLPFSNLLGLAPLDRWGVLLWQARLRVGLAYLPRLTISLIGSTLSTLLALPERLLAPLLIRKEAPAPVFIVGMPRSGTTHLHNLLALDPQFRSPRNYEVFNPHGFLTGWLTTALLTPFLTWRRPMDAVQMTVTSAQEEEFALAAMGSPSPYWSFCLPREIDRHDRYWRPEGFTAEQRAKWERHYRLFLRKLTCWRKRTPLLKNPANTGRISMLWAMFPDAKFIHIVRHPYAVWQSNQRLAEHGLAVFQLQDPKPDDSYATRALGNYRALMDAYYADTAGLSESQVAEVRFEDLEASPEETLNAIYRQLGLTTSSKFSRRLSAYLQGVRGYRKNRFPTLSVADAERIDQTMAEYLVAWGYTGVATSDLRAA